MMSTEPDEMRAMRLRRLRFRAWHRGMREVDLLLGRFADARLEQLTDADIAAFEALLDVPDRQVLAWAIGEQPVPAENDSALLRAIIAYHGGTAAS